MEKSLAEVCRWESSPEELEFMDTFDGGMWNYGDDSFPEKGVTFFAGTFVRHPVAMAAVKEVLLHLRGEGPRFWRTVRDRATRLAQSVDRMFVENGAPFRMPNFGSQMFVRAAEDHKYANLLFFHMRHKGVFLLRGLPNLHDGGAYRRGCRLRHLRVQRVRG